MNYRFFQRTKNKITPKAPVVEHESQLCSTSKAKVPVTDVPAATAGTDWLHRLFGHLMRKREDSKQRSDLQQNQKTGRRCNLFSCCRRKCRVAPAPETKGDDEHKTIHKPQRSPTADDQVIEFAVSEEDKEVVEKEVVEKEVVEKEVVEKVVVEKEVVEKEVVEKEVVEKKVVEKEVVEKVVVKKTEARMQVDWFGFPNQGQTCYINSSLQSLITLKGFTCGIIEQVEVWSTAPEAELIRGFINIVSLHRSMDVQSKLNALQIFKIIISIRNPEFKDNNQKDAHEFITSFLDQFRSLAPVLKQKAAIAGKTYKCAVEDNFVFKMQNTRTCKGCGVKTCREEEFTNLSLNLVSGASIQEMLQDYLREEELEFRCSCGAKRSGQQPTFKTLPKVLMLQVKRFQYTHYTQVQKLRHPVKLHKELMVTSGQGDGWYSLVSDISHLGMGAHQGHYVSDGIHPDVELDDPSDRWQVYNDRQVTEVQGDAVCQGRQNSVFIVFYERRM
ncbi:ubiquitin carboxyl-terminal hydrolase 37-like isoform X5 [Scomber scombrus]|uniref:Ubiquitin carboxyl-terminal hydrolase 37-like isoform X5 n=1 Tax=Scomber scombrus TaxID=13677 RepID=A0AAV1PT99_SCOSC